MAQAPESPPVSILANALINELDALPSPLVLVLDAFSRPSSDTACCGRRSWSDSALVSAMRWPTPTPDPKESQRWQSSFGGILACAVHRANRIDLAVAFIKSSGLALLFDALADAIETRDAQLRVLTSDYLDVTDPQALRRLLLLGERGADVRLFEANNESFHLKAYICVQTQDGQEVRGAAFDGSSNISRTVLTEGLGYILKTTDPDYPDYEADESMRTLARLDGILSPADLTLTDRHEFE